MNTCSICFDTIETNKNFVCLPCNHRFHTTCIFKWLALNNSCPCCRNICGEIFNKMPNLNFEIQPYIIGYQIEAIISQIEISHCPWRFSHMRRSSWEQLTTIEKSYKTRLWLIRIQKETLDKILLQKYKYDTSNTRTITNHNTINTDFSHTLIIMVLINISFVLYLSFLLYLSYILYFLTSLFFFLSGFLVFTIISQETTFFLTNRLNQHYMLPVLFHFNAYFYNFIIPRWLIILILTIFFKNHHLSVFLLGATFQSVIIN